jgi:hypothetical protein
MVVGKMEMSRSVTRGLCYWCGMIGQKRMICPA